MSVPVAELPALHTTGSFPELAVKNHQLRMKAVIEILRLQGIKSLIDLGCGDGALAREIADCGLELDNYLGLDPWKSRVESAKEDEVLRGKGFQFTEGSMTDIQSSVPKPLYFRDHGAIILLETIEHVQIEEVPLVQEGVFGYVSPDLVVVTTPDATNRLNEDQLKARGHNFEWDIAELQQWSEDTVSQFPDYSFEITQLGGPSFVRNTQIATFSK